MYKSLLVSALVVFPALGAYADNMTINVNPSEKSITFNNVVGEALGKADFVTFDVMIRSQCFKSAKEVLDGTATIATAVNDAFKIYKKQQKAPSPEQDEDDLTSDPVMGQPAYEITTDGKGNEVIGPCHKSYSMTYEIVFNLRDPKKVAEVYAALYDAFEKHAITSVGKKGMPSTTFTVTDTPDLNPETRERLRKKAQENAVKMCLSRIEVFQQVCDMSDVEIQTMSESMGSENRRFKAGLEMARSFDSGGSTELPVQYGRIPVRSTWTITYAFKGGKSSCSSTSPSVFDESSK